jgi:hypothetical protein
MPERLQDPHHVANLHLGYGQLAEERVHVRIQRVAPLLAVLGVAPAPLMRRDVGFGHLGERQARLGRTLGAGGTPLVDWTDTLPH